MDVKNWEKFMLINIYMAYYRAKPGPELSRNTLKGSKNYLGAQDEMYEMQK